jgi:hypothetical protein
MCKNVQDKCLWTPVVRSALVVRGFKKYGRL